MIVNSYYIANDGSLCEGLPAAEFFISPFCGEVVNLTQEKPLYRISGMNICFQKVNSKEWRVITTDMIYSGELKIEISSCGIARSRAIAIKRCDVAFLHLRSKIIRNNT